MRMVLHCHTSIRTRWRTRARVCLHLSLHVRLSYRLPGGSGLGHTAHVRVQFFGGASAA